MIKALIIKKVLEFLILYVDKNWETLVSQGKEKVMEILNRIKSKLLGEEPGVFGDGEPDPMMIEFSSSLDEVVAQAQAESTEV